MEDERGMACMQVGKAKVQFACASALAMLVEGEPEVCPQVLRHGGIGALTAMLHTAGAQGRKAAAEALQVPHLCLTYTLLHIRISVCCMSDQATPGLSTCADMPTSAIQKCTSGLAHWASQLQVGCSHTVFADLDFLNNA